MTNEAYNLAKDLSVSTYTDGDKLTKFNDTDKIQWIPIFRYAETKLSLAECYAKSNELTKAQNALNDVRTRSIKTADDIIDVKSLTGQELLTAIDNEKRLEFIGEGMRGTKITRKGETFNKLDLAGKPLIVTPSSTNYVWPIPERETAINKEINN